MLTGKPFETVPTIIAHEPPTSTLTQDPESKQLQHHAEQPHKQASRKSNFKQTPDIQLGVIGKQGLANLTTLYVPKTHDPQQQQKPTDKVRLIKQGIAKRTQQIFWAATHLGANKGEKPAPSKPQGKSR